MAHECVYIFKYLRTADNMTEPWDQVLNTVLEVSQLRVATHLECFSE